MARLPPWTRGARDARVAAYWQMFYVNKNLCTLCGNHGVLDTRGIQSPAGIECGSLTYCICPNGQMMRRFNVDLEEVTRRK